MRMSILRITMCLVGIAAVGSSAEAQNCVSPPAGLVGWWPGNANAKDAVAGNNGQLVGDATFAAAVVNQGFRLDGVGDYVEIPDSAALKPANVSVEAWVRFDSLDTPFSSDFAAPGQQYIVFKKNTRLFQFEGYSLNKTRPGGAGGVDRLSFGVANVNGFAPVALSTTQVVVGQFYHVVGTFDGSTVKMYVNGVLENQTPAALTLDYDTRPIFIGTSGEHVFDGKLAGIVDEASIYNRALDPSEIAALYAAGSAGKCMSVSGLLTTLVTFVQTLNLSSGISNSLDVKLQNVLQALDAATSGDTPSACSRLTAFISEVAAQSGKSITGSQAAQLTAAAQQIRTALRCR